MKNGGYSNEQLAQMQKDAVRRVNEMQKLSREKINTSENSGKSKGCPCSEKAKESPASNECKSQASPPDLDFSTTFKGMLKKTGLDSDSIILIMLLILFLNEGADSKLILALFYILI